MFYWKKKNVISKVSEGKSNLVSSIPNTMNASFLYGNGANFLGVLRKVYSQDKSVA